MLTKIEKVSRGGDFVLDAFNALPSQKSSLMMPTFHSHLEMEKMMRRMRRMRRSSAVTKSPWSLGFWVRMRKRTRMIKWI